MKVAIINYGMGNLKSIIGSLNHLGVQDIVVTSNAGEINDSDKIILPGVGAFREAMKNIKKLNLQKSLELNVVEKKKPILGICLGMQLMASFSEEGGFTKGLNYINGGVNKFEEGSLKIPHIGVNLVETSTKSKIYSGIKNSNCQFYFVHSYKLELNENCVVGKTQYISKFISSFEKDNIVGVQFHPELSQSNGLKVISNFLSKI